MQCPKCNGQNPDDASFCMRCGAKLAQLCPQCGTELPPVARFCFNCATPVTAPSPTAPVEEPSPPALDKALQRLIPKEFAERLLATRGQVGKERRIVTILFSDVKGSTAMAESLDPEDWTEIMEAAFDVLIEPIYRYEGTVARLMGDAIVAFFGAPIAHEDDPERACRAALEIVEGAQHYAERLEEERDISGFNVRVGINTGLVVVGEVGSDLRVEYTAMGDAINLAKRMESAAQPGTVLITEDTHKLIAHLFETEALGPIEVKGKAEPVPVYRVLAAKAVAGKPRGIAGLESPLVGRQAELHKLQEVIKHLRAGVGGIVTIVGEAGIGKSRLVAEVRVGARHASPLQWAEGRCLSYGTSTAYQFWLDMMRGLLRVRADTAPAQVRDTLREWVQALCPQHFEMVYPYLAQLMSLPLEVEHEASLRDLEGENIKAATFRAVETLIQCAATERPLVLVCEDLHWADPTSIDLLERLLALTDRTPLLFICLFRPQRKHGCWRIKESAARLYAHRHTDLWLEPLTTSESETLVSNLLRMESLLKSFKQRVLRHAEGNPFYLEELIRSLIDSGAIVCDEVSGSWQLAQDLDQIPVPETLLGVLLARIDRLPEDTKRVLRTASVIGRIFPYRLLEAIAGEERQLDAHLLRLQREQMIRERARLPESEYIFKHHLTHEAAYNGLLKKERRVLHRQVAETLEGLFSDRIQEQLELLAHHWEQAEELEKAVNYLFQAGERARRLGASLEAIDFYQSALQKATGLSPSQHTVGLDRIHECLGHVYLGNLSRQDEALHHYECFLRLARSDEDGARAARKVATVHLLRGELAEAQEYYEAALARLNDLPLLAETSRVYYYLAYLFVSRNQLDEAVRHASASLEVSRQLNDSKGLADAHRVMGIIAVHRDELEVACEHHERSLQLYRQVGDLPRMVAACNNLGDTYRLLGQMDRALERLNEGLEIARRIGDTRDEASLLQTTAELLLDQGQWRMAVEHSKRAVSAAEESGVASRIIDSHRVLAAACEAVGRLEDARCHLEIAETLMRDTQQFRFAPAIHLGLAQVSATQGDFGEARKCLEQALEAAGSEPPDAFLGLVHRCHGYVHSRGKNWKDAVVHLERSLTLLESANVPAEVGRTRLSLGTAYANRGQEGDRGRACEQLLTALSIFQKMGAQGYVPQLEMQLEELGCLP